MSRRQLTLVAVLAGLLAMIVLLGMAGVIRFDAVKLAHGTTAVLIGVAIVYFGSTFLFAARDSTERKRIGLILILCLASAMFWAGFEQAGSSFNLFAERYTQRDFFGGIPASWFQSLGPIFVITLAPIMASVWVQLGRRNLDPSLPMKFGLALVLLASGFLVMAGAAVFVARGQKVWPTWLMTTYLLHTFAELCLSPVGLSSVTKLAPRRLVGQMMGAWFLATSFGNLIAGRIAGEFNPQLVREMPGRFLQMVILPVAVGAILIALARPIKKLMAGVR